MMAMMTTTSTTMMVSLMMVGDDDDDDDDAVAAPRAGQAFAGRCVSARQQLCAAAGPGRLEGEVWDFRVPRPKGSVSSSETREALPLRGSLSEGAAVAVSIEGGECGAEHRRFWPGSGSPSSAESRDPPELGPAELDAGSAAALTAFVASPAWRCSSVKNRRR